MQIKQLSIFIENKPGRLADITEVLAENKIDMRAISVADTSDFGILRVIVDKPDEAVIALKKAGMTVSLSKVLAVQIGDELGALSKVIRTLSDNCVTIEYVYAFMSRDKGKAYVIIRADNGEKAAQILVDSGIEIATNEQIANM
ncbi:MAG: ACT domain-containing protein [Clostridia bacterium]